MQLMKSKTFLKLKLHRCTIRVITSLYGKSHAEMIASVDTFIIATFTKYYKL